MFDNFTKSLISLSAQMIKKAGSGHIGMAISSAPIVHALFKNHLNICSYHPKWFNRDRFVLSAGHGSALIYAILHFAGVLSLDDVKTFRHKNLNVPGHPEFAPNNFIDASTGPLGQGIANAVGMAIAEKYLANRWKNLKGLVNHYTYCLVGDGDLQEGISYEAMSLAGKLQLNKLIILHDSNDYQLDSKVSDVNIENLKQRVESQGWIYLSCQNDVEAINQCIIKAKNSIKPTFIEVKTIIGEGTTKQATNFAHSLSINENEIKALEKHFQIKINDFYFSEEIYDYYKKGVFNKGNKKYEDWKKLVYFYKNENNNELFEFLNNMNGNFKDFSALLDIDEITKINDSTKAYLKTFFNQLKDCKDIITLSADLASTTNCKISNNGSFNENANSGYILTGVREFAMGGILNGISLHGGLKCFAGTFLAFSDYMKPAIRMGAMSKISSNLIFTHDSYLVGNDGPSHQPYDQIPMLRAIENVSVWRPCDEKETMATLINSLNEKNVTNCLILTRQATKSWSETDIQKTLKGAYILKNCNDPDITLIANGSEVELADEVANALKKQWNINAKIVSCPCLKRFLNQSKEYIQATVKANIGIVSIEASNDNYWYELNKFCKQMLVIKATKFGFSDNGINVYQNLGFNCENILIKIKDMINNEKL